MANNRKTPLALAVALALASGQEDAFPFQQPIRAIVQNPVVSTQLFDDRAVTVISDDWEAGDEEIVLATEMMDQSNPFDLEDLDFGNLPQLAGYGNPYAPKKPCANYGGVAKLTVTVPKGGIVLGDDINCGRSVPKGAYGGRVCSVKSCKGYGNAFPLKAIPEDGFEFVKWGDACKPNKSNPYCTVTLKKSRKVSAKFRKIKN